MVFNDNSDEKTIIVGVYRDCINEITITTTCLSHISFSQVSGTQKNAMFPLSPAISKFCVTKNL